MTEYNQILVTFFLFSYNQEKYIKDACVAALAQTYSPLEIIFSDDCSSDRTFELIEGIVENYKGPHKIRINRNEKNLGLIGHVNKAFEISSGDLIVAAAGDDVSLPNRVKCLADAYELNERRALVIHSSATKINDLNHALGIFVPPVIDSPMSFVELVDCQSLYIGATAAWSRSIYTSFGPIVFADAYEDLVLGFRAVVKDSLLYVNMPLVQYRVGVGISSKSNISILNIFKRIALRKKKMKMMLDVYSQRLKDIGNINIVGEGKGEVVKSRLLKNINFQRNRLLFYENPLWLLINIFSKNFVIAIRSINSEVKHLAGLND